MSAEILREAASKMRQRAEAATQSPWVQQPEPRTAKVRSAGINAEHFDDEVAVTIDATDAEHIASWHPAVALAVADWLDHQAHYMEVSPKNYVGGHGQHALAVARAYLGSDR